MAKKNLLFYIGADIKEFNKAMTQVQRGLKRTFGEDAMSASRSMVGAFAGIGAALAAVGGASIKLAADMEQSRIAFTTLLGSAEKAEKFLKELSDFAAETPFELPGLIDASKKLLAFGFQAEQIKPMLSAIGDAIAGLGGGAEQINRVTLALGQMQAKGKVSAEEMNQLAELGIPAWEMLSKQIGKSIPEAMKAAERGAISASVAIPAILRGMNDKFGGLMKQQSNTILGLWSTAKDNISASLRTIGENIVQTFDLKTKLAGANQWLTDFAKALQDGGIRTALGQMIPVGLQDKIIGLAGAIAGAMTPALLSMGAAALKSYAPLLPLAAAGAAVAAVGLVFARNWEQPLVKLGAFTTAVGLATVALSRFSVASVTASLQALIGVLGNVLFALKAAATGAASFGEALAFLGLNPVGAVILALAAVVTGIGLYMNAQKKAREEEMRKAESLTQLSARYEELQGVMDDTTKSEADRKTAADEQKQAIKEIGDLFPDLVKKWDAHGNAVELDTDKLRENTQAALDNIEAKNRGELERLRKQYQSLIELRDSLSEQIANPVFKGPEGQKNIEALEAKLQAVKKNIVDTIAQMSKLNAMVSGTEGASVYYDPLDSRVGRARMQRTAQTTAPQSTKTETTEAPPPVDTKTPTEYLDGFTEAFSRAQEQMTTTVEREQEKQTTAFRNAQEDQLTEVEAGLQARRTAFERAQQDELDKLEETQKQATLDFEFEQKQQTQIKQNELDKQLRDFKAAQQAELDAIEKRYEGEELARNATLRNAIKPLQDRIKALRGEQQAEEDASKRADLVQAVADAEKELAAARLKGAPQAMEQAERKAMEARQALREWDAKQARETEIAKLEDQIKALEDGAKAESEKAAAKLKDEMDKKRAEQLEKLALKEEELRAEMLGFEKLLAQDKLNFETRQQEARLAKERELADLKTANDAKLAEELEAFKRKQEQDLTNWQQAQADQMTRYRNELEDLKTSFAEKLTEQQKFIADWNAGTNQLQAMSVPSIGNANLSGEGQYEAIQAAKALAKAGNYDGAAEVLAGAIGISREQAKNNLSVIAPDVPKFAKGAVAFKPTLGIFGDTPDGEAVTPLSWLAAQIQGVAERVAGSVAGLVASAPTSGRPILNQQTTTNTSKVEEHFHFAPGSVTLNAKDIKEIQDITKLFQGLKQTANALG